MAELATIARPYAEALFEVAHARRCGARTASSSMRSAPLAARSAAAASSPTTRRSPTLQVFELIAGGRQAAAVGLQSKNLLRAVLDNGRLSALPEIAAQFHTLVIKARPASRTRRSTAPIRSTRRSCPRSSARSSGASAAGSTRRCGSSPKLIGGIRVVVGDEVLDTSVKARLEQMKVACRLTGDP